MITGIEIEKPMDMHVHLREGQLMRDVLPYTVQDFSRALVMPNLMKPIESLSAINLYRNEIMAEASKLPGGETFKPLMTIKITKNTIPQEVRAAKDVIVAAKLYPEGVTTNSSDGVKDFKALYPIFEVLQTDEKVLCIHGEHPDAEVLSREEKFLPVLRHIASDFPKLRIVLEHVSTAAAVACVAGLPKTVAATITVHHLLITLDDVIGGMLKPHLFCKPIAKTSEDRKSLLMAAMSGISGGDRGKFFLGTDSAPHPVQSKECSSGCAGVFTAPVALPLLTSIFAEEGKIKELEAFTTHNAQRFYELYPSKEKIAIVREPMEVPGGYVEVVPFMAGRTLDWSVRRK